MRKKHAIIIAPIALVLWSGLFFYLGSRYQANKTIKETTKSSKLVPSSKTTQITSGTIVKVSNNQIEIKDLRGDIKKFTITDKTNVTKGGKVISISEVKPNDKARIIPDQTDAKQARQILIVVE